MIIFGKKGYEELKESLVIPGIEIQSTNIRFIPIYKVKITYDGKYKKGKKNE